MCRSGRFNSLSYSSVPSQSRTTPRSLWVPRTPPATYSQSRDHFNRVPGIESQSGRCELISPAQSAPDLTFRAPEIKECNNQESDV